MPKVRDALRLELVQLHVRRHRPPKLGKALAEADQPVEFRLLLRGAAIRVVEVLLPPGPVESGRLQPRARARGDPDVAPGRWDRERPNALERGLVGDPGSMAIEVAELSPRSDPPPAFAPRHGSFLNRCAPP
jgi:hypothetical protein